MADYRLTQTGQQVQNDLNNAEQDHTSLASHETNSDIHVTSQNKTDWNAKYDKPGTGIPASDFAQAVQQALTAALSAYQKPNDGIPANDLADAVQSALAAAVSAYQKPSGGIPSSDFTTAVQNALTAALSAYQKPNTGIPAEDLSAAVQSALTAATGMQQSIDAERDARAAADLNLSNLIGTKTTQAQVEALITSALASYTNTTGMNSAIASAITSALTAYYTKTAMDALLAQKQDKLTFDLTPTNNSQNPVTSDGIYDAIQAAVSGLLNTQQVQTLITNALASYSTTAEVSAAIATALQSYSTTAEVGTLITTALTAYATKEYVSQQVQEYQGTFRGTFDTLAELEATVGNHHNDYAWVKVTDSDGDNDYDRYKYNGTTWVYEYRLNNTHFTASELASIRSGMTDAKRQKLDALPTNADLTTALNGKQAVINDGAQIGLGSGVCTTAAATTAKEVTISNFILLKNAPVSIRFQHGISINGATLNISLTGAKPIMIDGVALPAGVVKTNTTATMFYDGTYWNIAALTTGISSDDDLLVDLGLPSGLLWATRNIDVTQANGFAASPYQYECSFFSWGNTEGHNPISAGAFDYDWGTGNDGPYASTPGAALSANFGNGYDAACVNLGKPWRLPTTEEFAELFNASYTKYINADGTDIDSAQANKLTTVNGVTGIMLKSLANGKTIFFPCSGHGLGSSWLSRGSYGYYWSSSLLSSTHGRYLFFYSGGVNPQSNDGRFYGFTGRAVQ